MSKLRSVAHGTGVAVHAGAQNVGSAFTSATPNLQSTFGGIGPGTWVLLLLGLFVLWLAARGRLSQVVYAMEHGTVTAENAPAPGTSGSTATTPPISGDPGTAFGFHPDWENLHQTGWLGSDQQIAGLSDASNEINLGTAHQPVAFTLPANSGTWTLQSESSDMSNGWGGYEVWKNQQGAKLGFLHLTQDSGLGAGAQAQGGQQVGISGWPSKPQYAVGGITGPANAHLAVVLNPEAQRELSL